jgi:hypothetical protein
VFKNRYSWNVILQTIRDTSYTCYFVSREKHGLVRNDFLDSMIELRKADNDEALGDLKSAKSVNLGESFSKLQKIFILLVTGHWVKFS